MGKQTDYYNIFEIAELYEGGNSAAEISIKLNRVPSSLAAWMGRKGYRFSKTLVKKKNPVKFLRDSLYDIKTVLKLYESEQSIFGVARILRVQRSNFTRWVNSRYIISQKVVDKRGDRVNPENDPNN